MEDVNREGVNREVANRNEVNIPLRSVDYRDKTYLRFLNRSTHSVDVVWLNYDGDHVVYKVLKPNQHIDIDTFTTHPWIFKEHYTEERFVINNQLVFWGRAPPADSIRRVTGCINAPLRDLRQNCLLAIARIFPNEDSIESLELPLSLQEELRKILKKYMGNRSRSPTIEILGYQNF